MVKVWRHRIFAVVSPRVTKKGPVAERRLGGLALQRCSRSDVSSPHLANDKTAGWFVLPKVEAEVALEQSCIGEIAEICLSAFGARFGRDGDCHRRNTHALAFGGCGWNVVTAIHQGDAARARWYLFKKIGCFRVSFERDAWYSFGVYFLVVNPSLIVG